MSKVTNDMNLSTIILMDTDPKLDGKGLNVIAKFEDVVIPEGEDAMMTLLKLAVNEDIKGALVKHNEKRTEIVNSVTLERTGNSVKLQPITVEQVVIKIK